MAHASDSGVCFKDRFHVTGNEIFFHNLDRLTFNPYNVSNISDKQFILGKIYAF